MIKKEGEELTCVIFTTHESFFPIYEKMRMDCRIAAVVVPANRKGANKLEGVFKLCREHDINVVFQPFRSALAEFHAFLHANNVRMGVSWSYSQILFPETLALFPLGVWNMHGGKIPEYRGANVLQWAIANGETHLGVTWHLMEEQVDAGDILAQAAIDLAPEETALQAREKIFNKGIETFNGLWDQFISTGIHTAKPDLDETPSYKPRTVIDGLLMPGMSRKQVLDMMRAQCAPWPAPLVWWNNRLYSVIGTADQDTEETVYFQTSDGCLPLSVRQYEGSYDIVNQAKERLGL